MGISSIFATACINLQTMYRATINDHHTIDLNPDEQDIEVVPISDVEVLARKGSKNFRALIVQSDHESKTYTLKIEGRRFDVVLEDRLDLLLEKMGFDQHTAKEDSTLKAPMPGLILSVDGKVGDKVSKGDKVLVLEAMKMENVIKAPSDGTVKAVHVNVGDSVDKNQQLIEFE